MKSHRDRPVVYAEGVGGWHWRGYADSRDVGINSTIFSQTQLAFAKCAEDIKNVHEQSWREQAPLAWTGSALGHVAVLFSRVGRTQDAWYVCGWRCSSRLNHRNQTSVTDFLFNMLSLCWFLWNKEVTSTFLKTLNLSSVTLLMFHAVFNTFSDVSWRKLHLWEYSMGAVPNLGEWLFRKHRTCLGFSKGFSKRFNTCFLPLCVFCSLHCFCSSEQEGDGAFPASQQDSHVSVPRFWLHVPSPPLLGVLHFYNNQQ